MEEKVKRRIEVTIAGITMSLVTDESESFVNTIVSRMDETMSALLGKNSKRSQLDAAMLCAIEFCGDKILAEKRVRNLEAQISLYDVNLRRLREENLNLRKKLEGDADNSSSGTGADAGESNAANGGEQAEHVIGEQISIGDSASSAPVTSRTSSGAGGEQSASSGASSDAGDSGSRDDKLKMIEALLRK